MSEQEYIEQNKNVAQLHAAYMADRTPDKWRAYCEADAALQPERVERGRRFMQEQIDRMDPATFRDEWDIWTA